jgi:hypothetical protein
VIFISIPPLERRPYFLQFDRFPCFLKPIAQISENSGTMNGSIFSITFYSSSLNIASPMFLNFTAGFQSRDSG